MKFVFCGMFVFLFSSLFVFSDNPKSINSNWTHYVETVDLNAKVISLNDDSRWVLIEGFQDGLIKEKPNKKNKKNSLEIISHKKGYPLLKNSLWV